MCDIYRNSILTIAASCSASDCDGFLRDRIIDDPIELEKPKRLQSVCFRQTIDHSRMFRDDPIHSRAWTFQETILPHRLLSFGSCEASWECEALRQCECRQIEYTQEARTADDELGRAAYRKYTRAVIEGRFRMGDMYQSLRPDSNSLPPVVPRAKLSGRLRRSGFWPPESEREIINHYESTLLARAPPLTSQELYWKYIEEARGRTVLDVLHFVKHRFVNYLVPFDSPQTKSFESSYIASASGKLAQEDVTACAKWLENTYLGKLAVSEFYRYWRRVLVPEYTRRALSRDTDRLIALQAIASDVHSALHDSYLAGLWEGDLINEMCWQSVDGRGVPADNQSPSWSWSSISGPVMPYLAEESEDSAYLNQSKGADLGTYGSKRLRFIDVDCSVAGQTSSARISSDSITLSASAMKVQYIKNKETGLFDFHADISNIKHPQATLFMPLRLDFIPDTPLGCGSDGILTRSTERDCLNTRSHDYAMRAILLFVRDPPQMDPCVLVCSLVPAATKQNTCRRLGIGTIRPQYVEAFSSLIYRGEFVLI